MSTEPKHSAWKACKCGLMFWGKKKLAEHQATDCYAHTKRIEFKGKRE